MIKSYSELIKIDNFIDRFNYLKLNGLVGEETFGSHRYLNQLFYNSVEWKTFKREIIIRDGGCDLGIDGYDIAFGLTLHHINPVTIEDFLNHSSLLLDPENVICVSQSTHRAIHYGDDSLLKKGFVERYRNDTCPWKG